YLVVFTLAQQPARLQDAVSEGLGTSLRDVTWDIEEGKQVVSLYARSVGLPHTWLSVRGRIDLVPIERILTELAVRTFHLRFTHPQSGFSEFLGGKPSAEAEREVIEYTFHAPFGKDPPIHFAFGYQRREAVRISAPLCALLLAAMGVTWGARRAHA